MTETTRRPTNNLENPFVENSPIDRQEMPRSDVGQTVGLVVDLLAQNVDESTPVIELEDRMLRRLGGSLRHPPALEAKWATSDTLDDALVSARVLISQHLSGTELLGRNDPRVGLLAAFWRRVIEQPIAAVIVIDEPDFAAAVISAVTGESIVQSLATYERYYRSVALAFEGQPVFVVPTRRGKVDETTINDVAAYFSSTGLSDVGAQLLVRPSSTSSEIAIDDAVLSPMNDLFDAFSQRAGANSSFEPLAVSSESPWTTALLSAERDLAHVVAGLDWATRQIEPIMRATPVPPTPQKKELTSGVEPEEETESREPEKSEHYPLNASEDRRAYHKWLRARHEPVIVGGLDDPPLKRAKTSAPRGRQQPLVSIVVPVWRTPLWALERCVSSVLAQTTGDWELCLCDDASGDEDLTAYLKTLHRIDKRISVTALEKNAGISAATNAAIAIAHGKFIAFLDHDDELAPNALEEVAKAISLSPDVDVLYSDEDKIEALGERFDPLFKPDWSPDLLLSFAYICHFTIVRQELVAELGGLRSEFDGSQDYDLSIRATEKARLIVHIPEVLYHWRTLPGSAASDSPGAVAKPWAYEAGRNAIEDAMKRRGEKAEVTADVKFPGRYHVRRTFPERPMVSVIIPFRDEPALLATCANSLREHPGYDRMELVLVDNGSELPETAALLERLDESDDVCIVSAPGPFNWAAINNAAVDHARGEMLVFANNDIEARVPRWLDALLGHALRPEVGAVGARLIYPDGAIQHAGVVIGLGGIAGHPLRGLSGSYPGYNSMAISTRNCSVVTGACMMTRRDVFESVGGFNELLPVAFNDVDYCLKLREKGFLIVYTPLAELIHHESRSRGHTDDLVESRRIVNRWSDAIAAGDPYMSKHLSHWRYWCPLSTAQEDDRWKTYLEMSVLTQASSSST